MSSNKKTVEATRALLVAAAVLAGVPSEAADSPRRAAEAMYAAYVKTHPSGLPGEAEMSSLGPTLTPRLAGLLREARRLRDEVATGDPPDDKPPMVDGCLFASLFEGPHRSKALGATPQPDGRQRVLVSLTYLDDFRPGEKVTWKDAVWVAKDGGQWLVDDVEYLGDWDFMIGRSTTLAAILEGGIEEWTGVVRARESERAAAEPVDRAIRQVATDWMEAYNGGKAAAVAGLYAPTGYYVSSHVVAHGRSEVMAYFQRGIDAGGHIDRIEILASGHSGDLGYTVGTYEATNAGRKVRGRNVVVVRLLDGAWRIVAHETAVADQP